MSLCSDGLSSDQYFLVNFIMSNYLGPDVYSDNPRCSASQRLAKGLPPYTPKHIGSSSLTVVQLQNLYYYVLRNAKSSLVLHPNMIYMYLKGYLPLEPIEKFPQFTYFFPTNLHSQKRYSPSHEIVKGIVLVADPDVAFISKEEIQWFRCLSRLDDLKIDRVVSLSPRRAQLDECKGTELDSSRNGEVTSNGLVAYQDFYSSGGLPEKFERQNEEVAGHAVCLESKTPEGNFGDIPQIRGPEHGCSRNGEATSNELVSDQDFNSSADVRETRKRKKDEEEAVVGHAVCLRSKTIEGNSGDIPHSRGTDHDCSRNGEATSNELVSDQDFNSSTDVQETRKRKKDEEEAVAGHAVCLESKTPEGNSGDIPQSQGTELDCSRKGEATSNELVSDQDFNSSADVRETRKRKKDEEEAVVGHAVCLRSKTIEGNSGDIPHSRGTDHDCSRNGEATSNELVSDQDFNSSTDVQETRKRKKDEEEAVAGHAVCLESKTPEGNSGDIPQSQGTELDCSRKGEATSNELVSDQDFNSSADVGETCKRKKDEGEAVVGHAVCGMSKTPERFRETYKRKRFKSSSTKAKNMNGKIAMERGKTDQPISLKLVPFPPDTKEKCELEPAVVTTGTASKGTIGPSIGVVDIGVNKVAYFFQVALPGVCKDYGEFSCEIESDGKVVLEGSTTTGGKTVKRHSRVFKMNTRKLCPPGPFKLCFSLPGPVDPRLFFPNFRSDGIFEAVIIRHTKI